MNVEFTGRQYEITPTIRKSVETGLTKIRKILGDKFDTKVILAAITLDMFAVLLGGATLLGVLTMVITRQAVSVGLPVSAGVTIYVAASDLIPEVNREPGGKMALVVFLGAGMLFLLDAIAHVH